MSDQQSANATTKKDVKQFFVKNKNVLGVTAGILAAILVIIILFVTQMNTFRYRRVERITVGMNRGEVKSILGEAASEESFSGGTVKYTYFSDNVGNKVTSIKFHLYYASNLVKTSSKNRHTARAEKLLGKIDSVKSCKYMEIVFENIPVEGETFNQVDRVRYDANCKPDATKRTSTTLSSSDWYPVLYPAAQTKTVSELEISAYDVTYTIKNSPVTQTYIVATIRYDDGSYQLVRLDEQDGVQQSDGSLSFSWSDDWGSYSATYTK